MRCCRVQELQVGGTLISFEYSCDMMQEDSDVVKLNVG